MSSTSREGWRDTILAGLANYIDAGSIVAGSAALALWKAQYGLSDTFIGLIAAFSANAISAGIGALIWGPRNEGRSLEEIERARVSRL